MRLWSRGQERRRTGTRQVFGYLSSTSFLLMNYPIVRETGQGREMSAILSSITFEVRWGSEDHQKAGSTPGCRTITVGITGIRENLGREDGMEEHYWGRSELLLSVWYNHYWFASDVTAAMLALKNKSVSLPWKLNSIFTSILREKIPLFCPPPPPPPTWATLSRGWKPRIVSRGEGHFY